MAYDTKAVANALVTVLQGLDGMATAQIGAPESIGTRVMAYVTMASSERLPKTSATIQRSQRFMVMFAYRVEGNESSAELALMDLVDAFFEALDADMTLGGVARQLDADSPAADDPDYQFRAGREYREYPVLVRVTQYAGYSTNP